MAVAGEPCAPPGRRWASGVLGCLTLNQVHGDVVLALDDDAAAAWEEVARAGAAGADGVARGRAGRDGAFVLRRLHAGDRRVPVGELRRGPRGLARGASPAFPPRPWRRWQLSTCSVRGRAVRSLPSTTPTSARISARSATSAAPTSYGRFAERFGRRRAPAAPITWIWKLPCAPASPRRGVDAGAHLRRRGSAPPAATTFTSRIATSGGRCGRHSAFAGRKEDEPCEYCRALSEASPQRWPTAAVAAGRATRARCASWPCRRRSGPTGVADGDRPRAPGISARTAPTQIVPKSGAFPEARWHFIGNVQSRRIPEIVACCIACPLAVPDDAMPRKSIDAAGRALGKVQDVLHRGERVGRGVRRAGWRPAEAGARALQWPSPAPRVRARAYDHGPCRATLQAARECLRGTS